MLGRRNPNSSQVPDEMENVPSWFSVSDERFVSLLMRMSAVFAWSSALLTAVPGRRCRSCPDEP